MECSAYFVFSVKTPSTHILIMSYLFKNAPQRFSGRELRGVAEERKDRSDGANDSRAPLRAVPFRNYFRGFTSAPPSLPLSLSPSLPPSLFKTGGVVLSI